MSYITSDLLKKSKKNNGWYKEQLELLKIPFPPPKNWKTQVKKNKYSIKLINQFINFIPNNIKNNHTYYAVANGNNVGVYNSWNDCKEQISGQSKTVYKKFNSYLEAKNFIKEYKEHKKTDNKDVTQFKPDIIVYTDGACSNNGYSNAKAGIGIYFSEYDPRNISKRVIGKQSNNVAELTAIIETLYLLKKEINEGKKIHIYSDSKYSIRCCTDYGEKCEKQNWKKDIPNKELVKEVYSLKKKSPNVELIHIKAHTSLTDVHSLGNEGADKLANEAIDLEKCPYA